VKRSLAVGSFALALAMANPSVLQAAEPPRDPTVVLVFREGDVFGARLEAELRSIGIRVVTRRRAEAMTPMETVAIATIRDRPRRRVEIRLGASPSPSADPDMVVDVDERDGDVPSIQAAERIRAAFEPLAIHADASPSLDPGHSPLPAPPPSEGAARSPGLHVTDPGMVAVPAFPPPLVRPAPRAPLPPLRPAEPRPWLGVGLGLGALAGAPGAELDATLSVHFMPLRWLRLEPFVLVPLAPLTLEAGQGAADIYAGALGARVGFVVFRADVVSFAVGATIEGFWLRAVGDPAPGYEGSTENGFGAGASADVTARVHLGGPLSFAPRASLGLSVPKADIAFGSETIATWGWPFVDLGVALEIEWAP